MPRVLYALYKGLCLYGLCVMVWGAEAVALAQPETQPPGFTDTYDALLGDYVSKGVIESMPVHVVDYKAWANDPRHAQAMAALKQELPTSDKQQALAYWINAYNFLTIDLVIKQQVTQAIIDHGKGNETPWTRFSWQLHGEWTTLQDIIEKHIAPLQDNRAYLALCNSAISAPDIRAEAYRADKLDAQLDDQARQFTSHYLRGVVVEGDTIIASALFSHYEEAFGGEDGALAFIGRYNPAVKPYQWIRKSHPFIWLLNSKAHAETSTSPEYNG